MSHRPSARSRGQATVELALGLLVLVGVLWAAIQFGELGILRLRTQQAAVSATWDATHLKLHRYGENGVSFQNLEDAKLLFKSPKRVAPATKERYGDFDGVAQRQGGQNGMKLLAARGYGLQVQCSPVGRLFAPRGGRSLRAWRRAFDQDEAPPDALACNASSKVSFGGMPGSFMEGPGGFFRAPLLAVTEVDVCGFGRGRNCSVGIPVLVDDWGLAGRMDGRRGKWESEPCYGQCARAAPRNGARPVRADNAFRNVVQAMFNQYNPGRVRSRTVNILDEYVGYSVLNDGSQKWSPVDPLGDLAFVFVGSEGQDQRGVQRRAFELQVEDVQMTSNYSGKDRDSYWKTSPFTRRYREAYRDRGRCFAGTRCDESPFKPR